MSHRDDLLAAARACLVERGFANTTARDLVAASGTNLASIGYHFGSKDVLLNLALAQIFNDYVEELLGVIPAAGRGPDYRRRLVAMVHSFDEIRPLFLAFLEATVHGARNDELRRQLADMYQEFRRAVADFIVADDPGLTDAAANNIASLLLAVGDGLLLQSLLDPNAVPSGEEIHDAAAAITATTPTKGRRRSRKA